MYNCAAGILNERSPLPRIFYCHFTTVTVSLNSPNMYDIMNIQHISRIPNQLNISLLIVRTDRPVEFLVPEKLFAVKDMLMRQNLMKVNLIT